MATYDVAVTANGLAPAVIYTGTEGSAGDLISFTFSSDWNGLTKEVMFFDTRGNISITSPFVAGTQTIPIPDDLLMYGGAHKFTVRGFSLDNGMYIDDALQVTGTIVTSYTAGHNPRLEGRILPTTLELFLYQAEQAMLNYLQAAKDSGDFNGRDGRDGEDGDPGTPAGFGTPTASAYSLSQDADPTVSVTASGSNTAKIFSFSFGIPKSVGKNFTILGHYNSLAALQAAVPNPEVGDAYSVGSSTPYNIYVYDGVTHNWANYGAISGGSSITVDTEMSDSSTNAVQNSVIKSYVDEECRAVLENIPPMDSAMSDSSVYPVKNFVIKQYVDSHTVTVDSSVSDSSTNAVQNKVIKEYVDDLIGDVTTALAAINTLIGAPASDSSDEEDEEEE